MKIIVIGGGGVFGSRLAEMLTRDGHDVTLAGRRAPREVAMAMGPGVRAVRLDREGDLSGLAGFDLVIDAAGPFHDYGPDPYRLARAAIEAQAGYFDLSDNVEFAAGIGTLDSLAKAAGVPVLSGVSSVPALSSAAAVSLMEGAQDVAAIDCAILPGNRAPRGRAVVDSILSQAGQPLSLCVDGQEVVVGSWSRPRRYDLGAGWARTGHLIGVPDVALFPVAFDVPTVVFRAGLELWPMRAGLAVWASFGRRMPKWLKSVLFWIAQGLKPFGSDKGGMVVEVTGRWGGDWERRSWRLRVSRGEGPYIPGIAARTLAARLDGLAPGARPAVAEFPVRAAEEKMSDLSTETDRITVPGGPLFPAVLGADFAKLPEAVRATHDSPAPRVLIGEARVTRGTGLWPRLIAALFRFPAAGEAIPVTVIKWPDGVGGENWERRFAGRVFHSCLAQEKGEMTERFGLFTFTLGLKVEDGSLRFPVVGARMGPLPLPRWALPVSIAQESETNGAFRFDVALMAPVTGDLIVRYQGILARPGG